MVVGERLRCGEQVLPLITVHRRVDRPAVLLNEHPPAVFPHRAGRARAPAFVAPFP